MDNNKLNQKKLYRSNTSKMLCGVCGGIGNYFGVDATLIRLLFIFFGFCNIVIGVLAYFIMAVIIPNSPYQE